MHDTESAHANVLSETHSTASILGRDEIITKDPNCLKTCSVSRIMMKYGLPKQGVNALMHSYFMFVARC